MSYHENRKRARITDKTPSLTDQSQARETDINVIIPRFLKTGIAPGGAQPISGDFTHLPIDLRGFIEAARSMDKHRAELPKELRELPTEELLGLTNEQLQNKLSPPAPPPEPPKEVTK